jgi:hypothetical protein
MQPTLEALERVSMLGFQFQARELYQTSHSALQQEIHLISIVQNSTSFLALVASD